MPRLCTKCHKRPPEVPDRNISGRPIKRVCLECHAGNLQKDAEIFCEKCGDSLKVE